MKRRIFSFILAMLLLVQAVPAQVFATSDGELIPTEGQGVVLEENQIEQEPSGEGSALTESQPVLTQPSDEVSTLDEDASGEDTVTEGASTWAFDRNTGYPSDLNDQVYIAIYKGSGFPGEPAWYPQNNYTFFNGNFSSGVTTYASKASDVLKREILDQLTQGPTTDGVKVWGHYSANGTKNYFVDGSPLTKRSNEEKIIRAIKGNNVDVSKYEIIWYVIKYQTDTYWHIDGLIVEKETYNVNYYGNGNSSGNAPTGATGLSEGYQYTVLGNTGNLKKVRNGYEFTFIGWNTRADGTGTHYNPGDKITITEDVSLYAQWQAPMINISVKKQWSDADNQDNIRPDNVKVQLMQNNVYHGAPVTLSASNNWTGTWNVPAFDQNGNEIEYHVEEEPVSGYSANITGSISKGFVIVNSHVPETVNVQAQKIWNDDNDRDGIRPYGIEVQLCVNGTAMDGSEYKKVMSKDNSWTAQWTGLNKNQVSKAGVPNVYTVEEVRYVDKNGNTVSNQGYTATYGEDSEVGRLTITNSYTPRVQDIQVTKVWNDANNQDGIRPASVTLTLRANGESTDKSITLDGVADANGETAPWVATFRNVYTNANGAPIAYSIDENEVSGYTYQVTGNAQNGFTVTNTHTPATTSVPVSKIWSDGKNQDGIRPASITVELVADDVPTGKTLKLESSNNWSGTFDGLQKFKTGSQGTLISYTVRETAVPDGYAVRYNGTTITNTHKPATIKVNVEKVWDDGNNQDGKRPDAVVVTLFENGNATNNTLTLKAENGWKGAWENLPAKHNGQDISYSAVETGYYVGQSYVDKTPAGYVVDHDYEVLSNGEHLIKIINTYKPEKTFVTVQKDWEDDDNRAGVRPKEITVILYRSYDNGETWTEVSSAKLDADKSWAHDFTELPKYNAGKLVTYKVEEVAVPSYTTTHSSISSSGVITIVNTRAAEKISVSAQKVWEDNNNRDGIRPKNVTVELYANGIATGQKVVLDGTADTKAADRYGYEAESWKVTFTDLYKHDNGKEVVYTVREVEVPQGYEVRYEGDKIINSHAPETISYPVMKIWKDASDQDGIRPGKVKVTLHADGVAIGEPLELNASNNWRDSFDNLPKYKEGAVKVEIDYSIVEEDVADYTPTYSEGAVTNTHEPAETSMSAVKTWKDDDNHDGQRPASVVVHLLANGIHMNDFMGDDKDYKRTLSASNNWTCTWEKLPEFAEGKRINYTVYEEAVNNGYSSSYEYDGNSVEIINTRQRQRTSFTVQKIWADTNNQDGLRYAGVMMQLYADGAAYGAPVKVDAKNHWRYTWTELPENMNGTAVAYSVAEVSYVGVDGAPVELTETNYVEGNPVKDTYTGVTTITNTHEVEKTSVSVKKEWYDEDNQDGKRPDSVTVELYVNGTPTNKTAPLTKANDWTYKFENLDVHHGIAIPNVYTVVETEVPAGYSVSYPESTDGTLIVRNSYVPEKISVPVSKVWEDGNNQDGIRPDSITVALYANDVATYDTLPLNKANNWHNSFKNLPKYENGEEIKYTVAEVDVPDGYESGVEGNVITNTHNPATTKLNVQKDWDDKNNQDGNRPTDVVITLYENGRATDKTLRLNAGNGWKGAWENMPVYHEGQRISYTAVETAYYDGDDYYAGLPAGYVVTHAYSETEAGEPLATLTNSYKPAKTQLNVQKVWDDDDNRAGKRPDSITVKLFANGEDTGKTVDLNPENEWDETFLNLDKNKDGKEIIYTVEEVPLNGDLGYTGVCTYNYEIGVATITNTRVAEKVEISVTKDWDDGDNRDGVRPTSITVELYANGVATGHTVKLDGIAGEKIDGQYGYESEAWKATFIDLYKYYKGNEIVYSIEEVSEHDGYETIRPEKGSSVIINKHDFETISYPVSKEWVDENDQDGIRPTEITVTLLADGNSTGKTLKLNASNNWHDSFDNLPKYKEGAVKQLIDYSVVESKTDGYAATYDEGKIINTHKIDEVSVSVKKVWNDNENQDGVRPASVVVHLLANGIHMNEFMNDDKDYKRTLSESNQWSCTWENLPKNAEAEPINYTVYEERVDNGYSASYSRDENDNIVITNTRNPDQTSFTVQKIWVDANNQDNVRYAGVKIQLYANGIAYGDPVEVNAENHWRYSWTGLPAKQNGKTVEYTVAELGYIDSKHKEVSLDEDYYVEGEPVVDPHTGIATITNTHTVEKTSVSVKKVWDDNENQDGLRLDSVTVTLNVNGNSTGKTAVLNKANNWSYTFKDLDVHHGIGIDNVYTVEETDVPEGYIASYSIDDEGVFIVTNTHVPELTTVPVSKVWADNDDQDGLRPEYIEVALYADEADTGKTLRLDASNNWSSSFKDLPKCANGVEIEYTVAEVDVPDGYTSTVVGYVITNTHTPETTKLNVQKVWDDENDQDGKRPATVVVTLYENGQATDKTLTLDAKNEWKGAWTDMPVYRNGQRITYNAVESAHIDGDIYREGLPEGYVVTHNYGTNEKGEPLAILTNSYKPEKTQLNVQKVWDDDDNRAGKRPESITVKLFANGVDTGKTVILNAANEWDATFLDLDKNKDGQPIKYSVQEIPLDKDLGYSDPKIDDPDEDIGVITITNSRVAEKISISAKKVWEDDNNRDGIRPKSVTVELYANGIPTGETVTLDGVKDTASTNSYGYEPASWTVEFTGLYEYYQGNKINYSIVEINTAEGYAVTYQGNQIINTHAPATTTIQVEKVWDDGDNQDGIRPSSITVKLMADGKATGKTLTMDAKSNWMGEFTDLLEYSQGKKIAYSVVEEAVSGYNVNATTGKPEALEFVAVNGKITVTNTHKLDSAQLTVVKVWDDGDDQDGKRPESITMHLLADGEHMGEDYKRVLNEKNGWTYTWTNLQKNHNGQPVTYTVYEELVGEDYKVEYIMDPAKPGVVTVRNSYTPEVSTISAVKIWNDDGNRDGLRPASVTVELYANEKATGKTLVLDAKNEWFGQWTDLPKYFNHGTEVVYDVVEIGYTDSEGIFVTGLPYGIDSVAVTEDAEFAPGTFLITNTHAPETTGVSVSKIWNDENNNDGKRPDGILVQLYANNEPVNDAVVELNDENQWTHTWTKINDTDLYVYMDGEPIVYTVDEIGYVIDGVAHKGMPEGYSKDVTAEGYQINITNTSVLEKVDVKVEKVWDDQDDNDALRPESLDVTLYFNDMAVAKVALTEEIGWTYTWKNLNKYVSGKEAVYTVQEANVEGYTSNVTTEDNTWVFVNTHQVATKDLTISKVWADKNNAEGLRPSTIKAQLYKNGEAYGSVITMTKNGGWKATVSDVPVYENGVEIVWTIEEVSVPKYYKASYDQKTLTITNTIQSKDIPQTGDSSNLMLWSGMMVVSSVCLYMLVMDNRKRRHNR